MAAALFRYHARFRVRRHIATRFSSRNLDAHVDLGEHAARHRLTHRTTQPSRIGKTEAERDEHEGGGGGQFRRVSVATLLRDCGEVDCLEPLLIVQRTMVCALRFDSHKSRRVGRTLLLRALAMTTVQREHQETKPCAFSGQSWMPLLSTIASPIF
jgi:hypothetical protein